MACETTWWWILEKFYLICLKLSYNYNIHEERNSSINNICQEWHF